MKSSVNFFQPFLWNDFEAIFSFSNSPKKVGSQVIGKLLNVRRESLKEESAAFWIKQIDSCIDQIKYYSRRTESQLEEMVLYSIEKMQCWTIIEISQSLTISEEEAKEITNRLIEKGIVYKAQRFIPGSGRKYYFLKSNRVDIGEADFVINQPVKRAMNS